MEWSLQAQADNSRCASSRTPNMHHSPHITNQRYPPGLMIYLSYKFLPWQVHPAIGLHQCLPQSLHPPLGSRGICTHFSCVSLFVWSDRLKAQTPRSDNSLPWQISTGRCRSRFKSQCFFYSTHFGLMFLWSLYKAPLCCVFFPNGVINPNTTFPAVPYSFKLPFNKFQIQRKRCLSGGFPLISFCGLSSP